MAAGATGDCRDVGAALRFRDDELAADQLDRIAGLEEAALDQPASRVNVLGRRRAAPEGDAILGG